MLRYGLATRVILVLSTVTTLALLACGAKPVYDDPPKDETAERDLLPTGGELPAQRLTELGRAARVGGCQLRRSAVESRDHTLDVEEPVSYATDPPTSGRHFQQAAEDGAYSEAPADTAVVHAFEHGRVGIWFRPSLPEHARAALRALFDADPEQLLLIPRANMPYEVAASAWNSDPEPLGTGRLLVCPRLREAAFDALQAFRDMHRSRGPEPIP